MKKIVVSASLKIDYRGSQA